MPMPRLASALAFLVAASLSPACHAIDGDPTIEPFVNEPGAIHAAPPSSTASSRGFLSRWFGDRASTPGEKAAVIVVDRPVAEVVAMSTMDTLGVRASELVANALGLLGVQYRRGGNSPESGFDCSGMVRYVFQNAAGLDLPRRAAEISRIGTKVDRDELRPGDLVFYNTLKQTFSHVGIYLGNNRFIHAPSRGSSVRIDDMTQGYWATRFNGARRVAE